MTVRQTGLATFLEETPKTHDRRTRHVKHVGLEP